MNYQGVFMLISCFCLVAYAMKPQQNSAYVELMKAKIDGGNFEEARLNTNIALVQKCGQSAYGQLLQYAMERKVHQFIRILFLAFADMRADLELVLATPRLICDDTITYMFFEMAFDRATDVTLIACIDSLVRHKANINCTNAIGITPLVKCILYDNVIVAQHLLKVGADINKSVKANGKSPLHHVKSAQMATMLLAEGGAHIHAVDGQHNTPLHIAVQYGDYPAIMVPGILLAYGASINARNRDGNTPLHLAVKNRNESIIFLLLNAGADCFIKNEEGQPPIPIKFGSVNNISYTQKQVENPSLLVKMVIFKTADKV